MSAIDELPLLDAASLKQHGRRPPVPFAVALGDGRRLVARRLLRVLPGKRIVAEAELEGETVLAKLFIGRGATRRWQRERDGLAALRDAAIPTPDLIATARIDHGGHALLTRFLDPARTLAQALADPATGSGTNAARALLESAFTTLGRLHQAGLVHDDLHLGNFLYHAGAVHVLDGDAVRAPGPGRTLEPATAGRNLALLLAQLPAEWEAREDELLAAYRAGGAPVPDRSRLRAEVTRLRHWRVDTFLAKTVRDCTLFSVRRSARRFVALVRDEAERLAPILAAPDRAIESARLLKAGRTATVALLEPPEDGERTAPLVIKRYNRKNLVHALSRLWRPSRAWHSWREGHRLAFLGIATPAPLALIEERFGPLRGRAWLVTEHCPGPDLLQHLDPDRPPPEAEARALTTLFAALVRERISHGDLKASNLLWHAQRLFVIDLDAMTQHRSPERFARHWRRDRARLLRNWPAGSALHAWLDAHLPDAPPPT